MTTNSYGSPLPIFDFPQTVAKATRSVPRRLPLASARGLPIVASVGLLAYYVGSQVTSLSRTTSTTNAMHAEVSLAGARMKALEDAYGDRSSLENLEAAARAYSASPVTPAGHPETEASSRFRESLHRAREH